MTIPGKVQAKRKTLQCARRRDEADAEKQTAGQTMGRRNAKLVSGDMNALVPISCYSYPAWVIILTNFGWNEGRGDEKTIWVYRREEQGRDVTAATRWHQSS